MGKEETGKPKTDSEIAVEMALDAKRRADNCLIDIKKILDRWGCRINPIVSVSGRGISANFEVVPLETVKA